MTDEPVALLVEISERLDGHSEILQSHGEQMADVGRKLDGQIAEHGRVAGLLQQVLDALTLNRDETIKLHESVRRMAETQSDDGDRIGALERHTRIVDGALHMVHSEPPRGSNGNGHG